MTNVPVGESEGTLPALFERAAAMPGQRQKLEAIRQLIGVIGHDFNNLLTPVIGGLSLIQRKLGGGEKTGRLISGGIEAAERAKLLAQRLLAFACCPQPGEQGPPPEMRPLTIFLAGGDEASRAGTAELLELLGHRVIQVPSASAAVDQMVQDAAHLATALDACSQRMELSRGVAPSMPGPI